MGKLKIIKNSQNEVKEYKKWKILIVDDEPQVHQVTKTVLSDLIIEGRELEFFSAFNEEEAINLLKNNEDIVVVFLDVVMESDDSGLIIVKKIREELNNDLIRIILRTGQPGSAPERDVIVKYKINDYKEKAELTADKLFTTLVVAIRSYQDLYTIKKNKDGLEKIIDASKTIFEQRSIKMFAEGILTQLTSLLNLNNDSLILNAKGALSIERKEKEYTILAATGILEDKNNFDEVDGKIKELIIETINNEKSHFYDDCYIGYFKFKEDLIYIVYISGCDNINEIDKKLTEIFSGNIAVAFNNLLLNYEIIDTQKEIIEKLGEVVEKRFKEASKHVHRVAEFSYTLAIDYGLSESEAQLLKMASPMHDVGKIGIPDSILLKEDRLTEDEFKIMKTHSAIGYKILKNSKRDVLKAAAIVAFEHHEKYDGTGYPKRKAGDDIHIFGRITAVADVFDALYHKRCYKEAWPLDDILELFKKERSKHFDPKLVDILFKNIEKYENIVNNI
jgi:response regulator RpfG family c-di-GMP phosphodiesterase